MEPVNDILDLLPHRPPFIMIGELLFTDERLTRTAFIIPPDNLFVDAAKWSEAGLMENMAQTVAAGAGYRAKQAGLPVEIGYIAAVKNFEVFHLPEVNARLVTETTIRESIGNLLVVAATVKHNDAWIARCELNIFVGSQS